MPSVGPRATMDDLIERVRRLIADPPNASTGATVFSALEIQDALDMNRVDWRGYRQELEPEATILPGGASSWLDFWAPVGFWEADATLQYLGATITPATADYLLGHWTFTTSQQPGVFITGKTFDVFRAAGDLMIEWAGKEPFTQLQLPTGGVQLDDRARRSRRQQGLDFYRRARPRIGHMTRSDCSP